MVYLWDLQDCLPIRMVTVTTAVRFDRGSPPGLEIVSV